MYSLLLNEDYIYIRGNKIIKVYNIKYNFELIKEIKIEGNCNKI
jgi:hypothetical protein